MINRIEISKEKSVHTGEDFRDHIVIHGVTKNTYTESEDRLVYYMGSYKKNDRMDKALKKAWTELLT